MNRKKLSARSIVAWIIGIYAAIIFLVNMPFMQSIMADRVESILTDVLDTKVEIGSVNVGFLNRIIINDISIEDQKQKPMLKVARVSASINLLSLLNGQIDIPTAQLYGTHATLYKDTPDSTPNYQFVIDAFASDDKTDSSPIDIKVNSFIVRKANIDYDIKSLPTTTGLLDTNHIHLKNAGFNLSLKHLTNDSLSLTLKRMSTTEEVSGLNLKELCLSVDANSKEANVSNLIIRLSNSDLTSDHIHISYPRYESDKSFTIDKVTISASVVPADLSCIVPELRQASTPLQLTLTASGTDHSLLFDQCVINTADEALHLSLYGQADALNEPVPDCKAYIKDLNLSASMMAQMVNEYPMAKDILDRLQIMGDISYQGNLSYSKDGAKSEGKISTDIGQLTYIGELDNQNILNAHIEANDIALSTAFENEQFGTTSFTIDANADVDCLFDKSSPAIPSGNAQLTIESLTYLNHTYNDIAINASSDGKNINAKADINDENINMSINADVDNMLEPIKGLILDANVRHFNTAAVGLDNKLNISSLSFAAKTNIKGSCMDDVTGCVEISDINIKEEKNNYQIENINLNLNHTQGAKHLQLTTDFAEVSVDGHFCINELASDFQNVIAQHLPALVDRIETSGTADFQYDATIHDAAVIHHFAKADYLLDKPLHINGFVNSNERLSRLSLSAKGLTIGDHNMSDVQLNCNGTRSNIMFNLTGRDNSIEEGNKTNVSLIGIARNNKIDSDIQINNSAINEMNLKMFATTAFADSLGAIKTSINIAPSTLTINDTIWNINHSRLHIYNKEIACSNFMLSNDKQYIKINGKASTNPKDRLDVELNSMSIENILDLINFHSVEFGGKASGHASVSNLYGKPDFNANLHVDDFRLMNGHLGNADITAFWDDEHNGIGIKGYFLDLYKTQNGLNKGLIDKTGTTMVDGYISPADNYINLGVSANDTSTDFLNGILNDVFTEIDGCINGHINVVGDLNDINIIGDAKASLVIRLGATNVPYYIDNQSVSLKFHEFDVSDVKITDALGHSGIVNGRLTHDNLARFSYTFDVDMTNLMAYNETEFNPDKYKATVFADGNLTIKGSDGHPLYIDATVSPAKGSVFAYDAATPDAISNNSFIEFRDLTPMPASHKPVSIIPTFSATDLTDSIKNTAGEEYKYKGDVYVNFIINVNPNCEIKLRMDNTEDGYITTFGNANFQAKWHNKGAFQLFGNYNITSGKYRLYLQDIVYRNLDIKEGSSIEFNGNPFEANVHLICHHEIQSVPLSDLTGTRAFSSNNKVKVICKLDITGHIDNMNLGFDFELPNSNEEVRQLVKSMVTSDEEMNNQMIYLLGFQRFYPNEFARANNENASTSAVNSLISSTISGQINQMLSNMIGRDSKWNFGTGISTGENGWDDLDVEGMLSGRLFNDRLLINGNFGYRDNALTNQANFIGDFEVKYRIFENGNLYVKAYNMTNDRYFTKATLNTQGIGVSFQHSFDRINLFRRKASTLPADTLTSDTLMKNKLKVKN